MPSQQAASALKDALLIVEQTQHPISTIHQVKGQEFPGICVVVPPSNLEELIRRLENNDIEEAERVLYVGITRAMRVCAIALPDTIVERFRALLERRGAKAETLGL
jgi:superfamily I DNA/RNA helicase